MARQPDSTQAHSLRVHSAFLSRYLLRAMGLGSLAMGVASACGGQVVVDSGVGGGGEGGATNTSTSVSTGSTTTGTGGTEFVCDVVPSGSAKLVDACLDGPPPASGCPAADSSDVGSALGQKLNSETCADFCCTTKHMSSVACGPDPTVLGKCCYKAIVTSSEVCMGRPFMIEGRDRKAELGTRDDWSAMLEPEIAALSSEARRALADAWSRDALAEHASIASFARFVLELLSVGAPASLVERAQAAIADEVRHARICFGLASAYANEPCGPSSLAMEGALEGRSDLRAIALAVVREGCIGETLASLSAMAARDAATDPAVREALDTIAQDEAEHAALAWQFVAWALRRGDADLLRAIEDAFAEAAPASPPVEELAPLEGASEMRAHGRLSASEFREINLRGLDDIIRPCAAELLLRAAEKLTCPPDSATTEVRDPIA